MKRTGLLIVTALVICLTGFSQEKREFAISEGDTTYIMKRYIFCLLMAGPNRDQDSATAAELQKGHMAHIKKMADSGQLIMAGPFEDGGDYRGIFIFDVASVEEAIKIGNEDPAIKAGRMVLKAIPWWAAKGTCLP